MYGSLWLNKGHLNYLACLIVDGSC